MERIFQNILTDEKSERKKKKKTGEVLARHTADVRKFHGLNRKNGVDIRRGINLGVFTLYEKSDYRPGYWFRHDFVAQAGLQCYVSISQARER